MTTQTAVPKRDTSVDTDLLAQSLLVQQEFFFRLCFDFKGVANSLDDASPLHELIDLFVRVDARINVRLLEKFRMAVFGYQPEEFPLSQINHELSFDLVKLEQDLRVVKQEIADLVYSYERKGVDVADLLKDYQTEEAELIAEIRGMNVEAHIKQKAVLTTPLTNELVALRKQIRVVKAEIKALPAPDEEKARLLASLEDKKRALKQEIKHPDLGAMQRNEYAKMRSQPDALTSRGAEGRDGFERFLRAQPKIVECLSEFIFSSEIDEWIAVNVEEGQADLNSHYESVFYDDLAAVEHAITEYQKEVFQEMLTLCSVECGLVPLPPPERLEELPRVVLESKLDEVKIRRERYAAALSLLAELNNTKRTPLTNLLVVGEQFNSPSVRRIIRPESDPAGGRLESGLGAVFKRLKARLIKMFAKFKRARQKGSVWKFWSVAASAEEEVVQRLSGNRSALFCRAAALSREKANGLEPQSAVAYRLRVAAA